MCSNFMITPSGAVPEKGAPGVLIGNIFIPVAPAQADGTRVLLHLDEVPFVNVAKGASGNIAVNAGAAVTLAGAGRFGQCAYLPGGADSYIDAAFPISGLNSGDWRIDLFFMKDGAQPNQYSCIMCSGYDPPEGTPGIEVYTNGSNGTWIQIGEYYTSPSLIDGWNHIAFVRSGSRWYVYLNGDRIINAADVTLYPAASFTLGRRQLSSELRTFKGRVDEFCVQTGDMASFTGSFIEVPSAPF